MIVRKIRPEGASLVDCASVAERRALAAHSKEVRARIAAGEVCDAELPLFRRILDQSPQRLAAFPYLLACAWSVVPDHPQHGVGDLVFTDGCGGVLVMEAKEAPVLHGCGKSRKNRKNLIKRRYDTLIEQILRYGRHWQAFGSVTAVAFWARGSDYLLVDVALDDSPHPSRPAATALAW